jgi:hypothetical protein
MTTRELRQILFHLDDQTLTVCELRAALFIIGEQGDELTAAKANLAVQLYKEQNQRPDKE